MNTNEKTPTIDDIVTPVSSQALPNRVAAAEARKDGRFGYEKPTADNCVALLIASSR